MWDEVNTNYENWKCPVTHKQHPSAKEWVMTGLYNSRDDKEGKHSKWSGKEQKSEKKI